MSDHPTSSNWRPRFSPLGIIGGLIASIGLLVILQQGGSVFPTLTVIVITLVLGVAVGIVLPTLAALTRRGRRDS